MSTLSPYSWRNIHPKATLHYIRDVDQANTHLQSLSSPVGFDLEWKPTFTKNTPENPVALVQLANRDTILLIQVSAMQEFPAKLKDFLESPDFVKAGVAIQNDVKKLYRDCEVSTRNCVDLSLLARCADNARWKGKYSMPLGLARLIEVYESLTLPKGKISRKNWEDELTPEMTEYAGNDAHAGFVLHQRLLSMANAMEKMPKPVYYTFDAVRGRLCEPTGMHWNCYNPDYDPGPPPPPRPPKEPTARELRRAATSALSTSATPSEPGTARDHLPISPGISSRPYLSPQNTASQRYYSSSRDSTEASSSILRPHFPSRRPPRRHYPPSPESRGPSVYNPSSHPTSSMFSPQSGNFRAQTAQPPAEALALPQHGPMGSAQIPAGSAKASLMPNRSRRMRRPKQDLEHGSLE